MINLSKTQKEIEELSKRVPKLTKSQLEWAMKDYTFFQWIKKEDTDVACPYCKEKVHFGKLKPKSKHSEVEREMTCPHCGSKIQVRSYNNNSHYEHKHRKRNHVQENFFEVMNVVGDWQVTRLIYMRCYTYIKKENTKWEFYECCQAWNNPNTHNTYFRALPKKVCIGWCYNPYSLCRWMLEENPDEETYHKYVSEFNFLSPRKTNGSNYFSTTNIAPRPQIHKQYKRMGLTADFLRRNVANSAIGWFQIFGGKSYKPMWETLIKAKAYAIIREIDRGWRHNDDIYFSAWKIANRHHYKIRDVTEWFDMLDMLVEIGMDYRNPKYICPDDEHAMHQELLGLQETKRREIERRKQKERDLQKLQDAITKYTDEYVKRITKYLDMDIHDDTLHIIVLPDIQAFYDEADHLCHCVFRSRYYLHTDSLILSARDAKGKRWETIEVSLRDFTIIQSYGYGDEHTEKHKEIENLVTSNMWQIKQRFAMAS